MALGQIGDVEAARELMNSAMAAWRKAGCNTLLGLFTQHLALIELKRGRYHEALLLAHEAIALDRQYHDFVNLPGAYEARARVRTESPKPDYAGAEADLISGIELARAQGARTAAERLAARLDALRARHRAAAG